MDAGIANLCFLITGASGGIGSAIARALAAEGAHLALHTHRQTALAEQLSAELATSSVVVQADLTAEDHAQRVFAEILAEFPRLDGVVVNAGIWNSTDTPIHEMTLQQWRQTVDADLTSAFLTCRAFMRHLVQVPRNSASIVLVGSTAALFGEAGHVDYAAAKAGMVYGLTNTLKNEIVKLAPAGRVNCVCPGWTATPMTSAFAADQQAIRKATATMPLKKIARAEDIAAAVVTLLSPTLSAHVSGAILPVAGGMEGRLLREE